MLKLFKSHLAFVPVIIIAVFMIVLRIDVILSNYSINLWQNELSPFSLFLKNNIGLNLLTNVYFNLFFSAVLVFVQAGIIISIFELFKNTDLKTFLPAWIFVMIMHLHPNLLFLSPQLFSFTFILLAFRKLIVFVEIHNKTKAIFDLSLFIGIATMFWLPSVFFLFYVFYFLNKKSKLDIRAFLSVLFTSLIPFLYVLAYYLLSNQWQNVGLVFNGIAINNFQLNLFSISQELSSLVLVVLFLSSIYFVSNFISKQLMDIKDLFTLIGVYIFNTILVYLFQSDNQISMVIFLFFPVAIFLSILFNRIKRNILAEFIHLALLLSIIINFMNFT